MLYVLEDYVHMQDITSKVLTNCWENSKIYYGYNFFASPCIVHVGIHSFWGTVRNVNITEHKCWWSSVFVYNRGVEVVPLLQWLGASERIIAPFTKPGVGHAAVTYLMYKLATPLRYTVTIGGTHLSVKYLRRWGYLPPIASSDTIRSMVKTKIGEVRERRFRKRRSRRRKHWCCSHVALSHHPIDVIFVSDSFVLGVLYLTVLF